MVLEDDLPSSITNDYDIELFINAYKMWNANDSKDVSPVFPRDILHFVDIFLHKLELYIKQRNNPVSPTIADSEEKDRTPAGSPEVSYSNSSEAYGLQRNKKRYPSDTNKCEDMSLELSALQASVRSMKDKLDELEKNVNYLRLCVEHLDGELESYEVSRNAIRRKRRRTKINSPC